jgi:hypothetical protein
MRKHSEDLAFRLQRQDQERGERGDSRKGNNIHGDRGVSRSGMVGTGKKGMNFCLRGECTFRREVKDEDSERLRRCR